MKTEEALHPTREIIRRKHLALSTEDVYCAWLKRYCQFVKKCPPHMPSQQKLERFLTALAKQNGAASPQNQAFNAIVFSYAEVLEGLETTMGYLHAKAMSVASPRDGVG